MMEMFDPALSVESFFVGEVQGVSGKRHARIWMRGEGGSYLGLGGVGEDEERRGGVIFRRGDLLDSGMNGYWEICEGS
jgi:hypothetical protein